MDERTGNGARSRAGRIWYELWPLAALCVFTASRWLVEGALPETSSSLASQALGYVMAAGVAGLLVLGRGTLRRSSFGGRLGSFRVGFGVCLVLAGPVLAQALGGRHLASDPATLALALVPVVAAVASSTSGGAETGDLPGLLWPGLAGMTGLLLLLPQPSFGGWRPWVGLAAMPLLVGVGGWLGGQRGLAQSPPVERVSVEKAWELDMVWGLLLAAGVLGGFWLGSREAGAERWSWAACALDGLAALLTLFVLRRLGALRWSSQFLLVPLLGLVEGLVFLRPAVDFRSWVGMGLLAVGGAYQLVLARGDSSAMPSLRGTEGVPEA